ncbi:hypothetical protein ABZ946_23695 [Streptomyces sp. NPDC046324]
MNGIPSRTGSRSNTATKSVPQHGTPSGSRFVKKTSMGAGP